MRVRGCVCVFISVFHIICLPALSSFSLTVWVNLDPKLSDLSILSGHGMINNHNR